MLVSTARGKNDKNTQTQAGECTAGRMGEWDIAVGAAASPPLAGDVREAASNRRMVPLRQKDGR